MPDTTTAENTRDPTPSPDARDDSTCLAFVVAWCAAQPRRVGEVLLLAEPDTRYVFGRGEARAGDEGARLHLVRQRPGTRERRPPLEDPFLSRTQIAMRVAEDGESVEVENLGKRSLVAGTREVRHAVVRPGEAIEIRNRLVLLCVRRPRSFAPLRSMTAAHLPPFGDADSHCIVGEGSAAWELRDRIAFVGPRPAHVLLLGESGTGKELVAQALHAYSARHGKKLVARNAATFPATLIDAELFGNAANYPNAGMPERPGLIGEADGSTLFLDEIGELLIELQTHLLRVLDAGEYQRLGDARRRTADLRLIAATNRAIENIKDDLAARFLLRIEVPGLDVRREDIPLLARHLLRRIAGRDSDIGSRFFEAWDGTGAGEPRLHPALVRALVEHRYVTHVRELERLLWRSLTTSSGNVAELTREVRADLEAAGAAAAAQTRAPTRATEVTEDQVRAALAKHGGVRERAWRELGLANRYALKRLIRKYGVHDPEE